MNPQLSTVVLLLAMGQGLCQFIYEGDCPSNRPVVENFVAEKYAGKWYGLARYEIFYEHDCDCVFAIYTINSDDSVSVENNCKKLLTSETKKAVARAVVSFPNDIPVQGKLNVTFGSAPNMGSNYWILDTDYNHYSIVYHCRQFGGKAIESAWILSRDMVLIDAVKPMVDKYVDSYFRRDQFRWTQQDPKLCAAL